MATAAESHPFPFRTRKLSPHAPMVLGERSPGRVGRRRICIKAPLPLEGAGLCCLSRSRCAVLLVVCAMCPFARVARQKARTESPKVHVLCHRHHDVHMVPGRLVQAVARHPLPVEAAAPEVVPPGRAGAVATAIIGHPRRLVGPILGRARPTVVDLTTGRRREATLEGIDRTESVIAQRRETPDPAGVGVIVTTAGAVLSVPMGVPTNGVGVGHQPILEILETDAIALATRVQPAAALAAIPADLVIHDQARAIAIVPNQVADQRARHHAGLADIRAVAMTASGPTVLVLTVSAANVHGTAPLGNGAPTAMRQFDQRLARLAVNGQTLLLAMPDRSDCPRVANRAFLVNGNRAPSNGQPAASAANDLSGPRVTQTSNANHGAVWLIRWPANGRVSVNPPGLIVRSTRRSYPTVRRPRQSKRSRNVIVNVRCRRAFRESCRVRWGPVVEVGWPRR